MFIGRKQPILLVFPGPCLGPQVLRCFLQASKWKNLDLKKVTNWLCFPYQDPPQKNDEIEAITSRCGSLLIFSLRRWKFSLPSEGTGKSGSSLKETHSDWWVAITWSKVVMLGRCWSSSHCWPQADPRAMPGVGWVGGLVAQWTWAWGLLWGSRGEWHSERRQISLSCLWLICQVEICLKNKK